MPTDYEVDAIPAGMAGWVPTINGLCYGAQIFQTRRAAIENAQNHAKDLKLEDIMRRIRREVPGVPVLRLIDGGLK